MKKGGPLLHLGIKNTEKDIIKSIEDAQLKPEVDSFRVGDTVRVSAKVVEGSRERTLFH